MTTRKSLGLAVMGGYIATIFLANWAIQHWGIVPVGFGLSAPAGVYFVGVAFTLRDITQELIGRVAVIVAILAGAVASYVVAPTFAVASATAFLLSESLDFAVYTPLRDRGWLRAVTLSNIVGLIVDSVVFLWLAFHSLHFLQGQIVGKAVMTAAAVSILAVVRGRRAELLPGNA